MEGQQPPPKQPPPQTRSVILKTEDHQLRGSPTPTAEVLQLGSLWNLEMDSYKSFKEEGNTNYERVKLNKCLLMRHKSISCCLPQCLVGNQPISLSYTPRSFGTLPDRKNLSPRKKNWIIKWDGCAFLPEFLRRTWEKPTLKAQHRPCG